MIEIDEMIEQFNIKSDEDLSKFIAELIALNIIIENILKMVKK